MPDRGGGDGAAVVGVIGFGAGWGVSSHRFGALVAIRDRPARGRGSPPFGAQSLYANAGGFVGGVFRGAPSSRHDSGLLEVGRLAGRTHARVYPLAAWPEDGVIVSAGCLNGARHTSPGCNPGYGCVERLRSVGTPHRARAKTRRSGGALQRLGGVGLVGATGALGAAGAAGALVPGGRPKSAGRFRRVRRVFWNCGFTSSAGASMSRRTSSL